MSGGAAPARSVAFWGALSAPAVLLLAFVVLPIATLILTTDAGLLRGALGDGDVRGSIALTLAAGLWATGVALLLGVPLAYVLARGDFRGKSLVGAIVDLPVVIPHSAAGIALLTVFGRSGFGGRLLSPLGLRFVGDFPGIVIAMLFVGLPFLVHSAREGFESIDPRLEETARTLGAGPWGAFSRVSLPLAARAILSGGLMMWARGISEFGAVVILVYHPMATPILVWERFTTYGLDAAKAVAVLLVLACLLIFGVLRAVGARRESA